MRYPSEPDETTSMSLAMEHERDNIFRLDLQGTLRKIDLDRCQQQLVAEIERLGAVRLLIVLEDFTGWDPNAPWNDLTFYVKHGDAIERIAIVGPDRWRSHMLMFAAADLRKGPVEYFPPDATAEARAWLAAPDA
jgi:hypothetical protein